MYLELLYIYLSIYTYIYIYICMHITSLSLYTYIYIYIYMYTHIYARDGEAVLAVGVPAVDVAWGNETHHMKFGLVIYQYH